VNSEHSPHCHVCKARVRELLAAIYGDCRANHQFPWPSHPQDYVNTAIGSLLEQIRIDLGEWRGHRDFIKSAQMPPCDYFIPDPPFIVEFDENQHFSRARLITLNNYPDNAQSGFSISRWRELCHELDAKDNKPFDRDERRGWYDVLRDWVPQVHGFAPTVRLYAGEFDWCTLDAASTTGTERFMALLSDRLPGRLR
jgi:hypothetical protein